VNLTGATSDYELQVGEEAYIEFSNATTVPLRISVVENGMYYNLLYIYAPSSQSVDSAIMLLPNNTTYTNQIVAQSLWTDTGNVIRAESRTYSAFSLTRYPSIKLFIVNTHILYKHVFLIDNDDKTYNGYGRLHWLSQYWDNTTTPWTSLGTITAPENISGYILIRRLR